MKTGIPLSAVGHASSLFLSLSFSLCVAWDLLFPNYAMHPAWHTLLPGFEWLSWSSFGLGLLESYAYGWFFALIWIPLYNLFSRRSLQQAESTGSCCQHSQGRSHGHT